MAIPNYLPLFGNRVGISTTSPTRLVLDGVAQPSLDLLAGWAVDARTGVSGAVALNLDLARAFSLLLTDDVVLSLSSATAGDPELISALVRIEQGAGGGHEVTWPGSVAWSSGYAPSLLTAVGGVDILQLLSFDGGQSWSAGRIMQTEA